MMVEPGSAITARSEHDHLDDLVRPHKLPEPFPFGAGTTESTLSFQPPQVLDEERVFSPRSEQFSPAPVFSAVAVARDSTPRGSREDGAASSTTKGSRPRTLHFDNVFFAHAEIPGDARERVVAFAPARPPAEPSEVSSAVLDELRDLLEHIRVSLDARFARLEQRLDAHIEDATARTSLLDGDVKILAVKLKDSMASMASMAKTFAAEACTSASAGKPAVVMEPASDRSADALLSSPVAPLQSIRYPRISSDVEDVRASSLATGSGTGVCVFVSPFEVVDECSETQLCSPSVVDSGTRQVADVLGQRHRGAEQELDEEGARRLIARFATKFGDTQRLLAEAQDRIREAGREVTAVS